MKSLFILAILFVLSSCTEEPKLPNEHLSKAETPEIVKSELILDTIYAEYGQGHVDSIPQSYDTTFLINDDEHTLHISLKLNGNKTVHVDETYKKDNKIHVSRYYGRDIIYQFHLTNANHKTVWKKRFTKKDYFEELGSIVAQSNIHLPEFKTYLATTKQLILTQYFWVPESDVGVQGILFFDLSGNSEIKYHCWYGSGGSDCDVIYSPDSSFLLTCSEIITNKGRSIDIQQQNSVIAGNMIIGNQHVFASYAFYNDTSALGGRIYDRNGKVICEFKFSGYGGALGYTLPRHYLKKFGRYYFVDEQNKFLLMIPEKNPAALKKYPFKKLRYDPNELDLDTTLVIQKEVSDHRFGIDSLGEVRTYQVGDYTKKWKFFDDAE